MAELATHRLAVRAEGVFEEQGFTTRRITLPQSMVAVLVAENPYAVAAVIGADDWSDVEPVIGDVATDFANWALSQEPGAKQWDLYLVALLAQPVLDNDQLAAVEAISSDTRYVRRLVRHGISADESSDDVRVALAALLPIELPTRIAQRNPFEAMVGALRAQGVEAELAAQTVRRFIERGSVDA